MKRVIGGFAAFALGLLAAGVAKTGSSHDRWTLLCGRETRPCH